VLVITVIVLFHLFLNPQGLPMAAVMVVCSLLLLRAYWPQSGGVPQLGLQGRNPARAAGAIRLH
jgi:hypothetical protein